MKINKLSLPHPVLGLGDDVTGEYSVDVDVRMGKMNISLNIAHHLSNASIEQMIEKGEAIFCVDINCSKTIFRKTFLSQKSRQLVEIETNKLRDKVVVAFYVVAQGDINNFSPHGAHQDYSGTVFFIRTGDVLAYGGETQFMALKRWEDQKGISSFLVIRPGENKSGPYDVDLNSDKIIVTLSKEDYSLFRTASLAGFDDIFLSSIVLPVLTYALNQMLENSEHYSDYQWYQLLEFRMRSDKEINGIDFESENIPRISQLLLASPLGRTLFQLNTFIDNSFEVE